MNNKQQYFSEFDRKLLDATSRSTWTPPDPVELIAPYMSKDPPKEGETDLERRFRKAKEVVDKYTKIEGQCKALRRELMERCKDVVIPIDPVRDYRVLEAATRLFRREVTEITFEMYTQVVHGMAALGNTSVPKSARPDILDKEES
jgi:hypothetical protein